MRMCLDNEAIAEGINQICESNLTDKEVEDKLYDLIYKDLKDIPTPMVYTKEELRRYDDYIDRVFVDIQVFEAMYCEETEIFTLAEMFFYRITKYRKELINEKKPKYFISAKAFMLFLENVSHEY